VTERAKLCLGGGGSKVESFLAYVCPLWRRGWGEPYDQPTFRHLLAVERKRAERSKRPVLVALVSVQIDMEAQRLSGPAAAGIFTGLARCVREVDFIGWHRQDHVAGAVLVQGTAVADAVSHIEARFTRTLCDYLPADLRHALRVRVKRFHRKARA
jgi:hypothetical protein